MDFEAAVLSTETESLHPTRKKLSCFEIVNHVLPGNFCLPDFAMVVQERRELC
jgi:hypothetical protein